MAETYNFSEIEKKRQKNRRWIGFILIMGFMAVCFFGCATSKPAETEVHETVEGKIVQDETGKTIKFYDESGKETNTIKLGNMENNKEGYDFMYNIKGVVSENGKYAGVEWLYDSSSTFKYYNSRGDVLWEQNNLSMVMPESFKISTDGYRVFMVTETVKDVYADSRYYYPCIFSENGDLILSLGEYDEARDIYLTKNGKYGYFNFGRYEENKWNNGILFFDMDNKKIKISNEIGYPNISEDGKAQISEIMESIDVLNTEEVEFRDADGNLKFRRYIKKMSEDELNYFTKEELEQIEKALNDKIPFHMSRKKLKYEYQF